MRAIVFDKRLHLADDYPKPEALEGEALIKVSCAGICSTDIEITKGYMAFKGVPGHEFAGTIEECGLESLIGRRVVGEINLACGGCDMCRRGLKTHCPKRTVLGILGHDGAFAEYLTLPVDNLHMIPDSVTDEEAVFVEPLAAVYEILAQVDIKRDTRLCVIGDGRLGLLAAEVLSLAGCDLIAIGRHREKLKILDSRGIKTKAGAEGIKREFDVVVECAGSADGFSTALSLVRPGGTIVLKTTVAGRGTGPELNQVVIDEITVVGSRCGPFKNAIKSLEEGLVDVKPLVSGVYPLKDGLKAFEYAAEKGVIKVILKVS